MRPHELQQCSARPVILRPNEPLFEMETLLRILKASYGVSAPPPPPSNLSDVVEHQPISRRRNFEGLKQTSRATIATCKDSTLGFSC
jgi:hypothetical protein